MHDPEQQSLSFSQIVRLLKHDVFEAEKEAERRILVAAITGAEIIKTTSKRTKKFLKFIFYCKKIFLFY